jgi:hypothetical protein
MENGIGKFSCSATAPTEKDLNYRGKEGKEPRIRTK